MVAIGHVQLSLLITGRGLRWGIGNNRAFNYLSDFAENWPKGVYTCIRMTPLKSFLNQTTHSIRSKIQTLDICLSLDGGILGSL